MCSGGQGVVCPRLVGPLILMSPNEDTARDKMTCRLTDEQRAAMIHSFDCAPSEHRARIALSFVRLSTDSGSKMLIRKVSGVQAARQPPAIQDYLHLSIAEASQKLQICPTLLKKICRSQGIERWPARKVI